MCVLHPHALSPLCIIQYAKQTNKQTNKNKWQDAWIVNDNKAKEDHNVCSLVSKSWGREE